LSETKAPEGTSSRGSGAGNPARLLVMASGNGSNLQAIIDACASGELDARVVTVISDQPGAYALKRAELAGIPAQIFPWKPYREQSRDRRAYDADLASLVHSFSPDWIVLAGWMRLLSSAFLDHFPMKVINLHPALPGTFPGTHAIDRAWHDYRSGTIEHTGVMVHFVPDEGVDSGPVITYQIVPIGPEDNLDTLTERIHRVEHRLLISALRSLTLSPNPAQPDR
jgi:phosphoribosylglycinamide formyltransferase 1